MADYKELLSDKVGTILNRAKELAGSEAVSGTVDRVREAASSSGILSVYEKGAQRAKSFGDATRLSVDLNRDYKELNRVFAEIGKLYYEQAKAAPEGFFVPLFQQADTLFSEIAEKEARVSEYKAAFASSGKVVENTDQMNSDIADFEEIVNRTETDGTST